MRTSVRSLGTLTVSFVTLCLAAPASGQLHATLNISCTRGESLAATQPGNRVSISPRVTLGGQQIAAAHHEEPVAPPQIGAEGEIYDPPFFRPRGTTRTDGTGGFGPMASNDFGNDLDIPTVIRNLSD